MKHARTKEDMEPLLNEWLDLLDRTAKATNGVEALVLVMRYLYQVSALTQDDALRFVEVVQADERVKEAVMTGGERLREEGRRQGIEQGRQEGERALLIRQLRGRFGPPPAHFIERVETATPDALERLGDAVLTARSLEELFGLK